MNKPLLEDIATFLTTNKVVAGDGKDTFRDFSPDTPDNIVCLIEYPGDGGVHTESVGTRYVQVSIRDKNADAAREKALAIFKLLKTPDARVDFTATRWAQVFTRQSPFLLKRDSQGRVIYGFNVGIITTFE